MALFLEQLRANENALVTIDPGQPDYFVRAFVTEDFGFGGGNQLNSAMEAVLGKISGALAAGNSALGAAGMAGAMAGNPQPARTISGGDSLMTWIGSERPKFTLNLLFLALNDDDNPVTEAQRLLRYVYPDGDTGVGMLTAPFGYAPRLGTTTLTGASSVSIGRWFRTPRLFLATSLQMSVSQRTDPRGVPLYVQAQISFEAARLMTYDEVQGMFVLGSGFYTAPGQGGYQQFLGQASGAVSGAVQTGLSAIQRALGLGGP